MSLVTKDMKVGCYRIMIQILENVENEVYFQLEDPKLIWTKFDLQSFWCDIATQKQNAPAKEAGLIHKARFGFQPVRAMVPRKYEWWQLTEEGATLLIEWHRLGFSSEKLPPMQYRYDAQDGAIEVQGGEHTPVFQVKDINTYEALGQALERIEMACANEAIQGWTLEDLQTVRAGLGAATTYNTPECAELFVLENPLMSSSFGIDVNHTTWWRLTEKGAEYILKWHREGYKNEVQEKVLPPWYYCLEECETVQN